MRVLLGLTAMAFLFGGIAEVGLSRIELITLPPREEVRIRFLPFQSAKALIQERRNVTLEKGENLVEFSWAKLDIDLQSVRITPMPQRGEVEVESISIRPGSAHGLIWHVTSSEAMEVPVYISYLASGIKPEFSYTLILDGKEEKGDLICRAEVVNTTPEVFQNAQVEFPFNPPVKLTIKGRESRAVELFKVEGVPVEKLYVFDPRRSETTSVYYVFKNDEVHGLGRSILLSGQVHVYKAEGDGFVFLSEDILHRTPLGDEVRVRLGGTKEVEVKKELLDRRRTNIRRTADQRRIALCDIEEKFRITAQNHREEKVRLEIYVTLNDEWEMKECSHKYEKENSSTIKFTLQMEPGSKEVINFRVLGKNIIGGQIRPVVM